MVNLGDTARTRRLAGNPATTNVSDADIVSALEFGTSEVLRITGKLDWITDTTNLNYASAVTSAEYYASSVIRDRFDDQSNISTEHFRRADQIAKAIANDLANADTAQTAVAIRAYRSYPLNSSATIYRSMGSQGQELVGTGDYEVLQ